MGLCPAEGGELSHTAQLDGAEAGEIQATIRGLRGMVIHLLPRVRRQNPVILGRDPVGWAYQRRKAPKGCCPWCFRPCGDNPRRRPWHPTCVRWYTASRGCRQTLHGKWVIPLGSCPCGEPGEELDHRTPIMLAAHQGRREYIRAFLLPNLQWLCGRCHREKSRADARRLADTKAGRLRMF